ncbi:hypothetical protein MG293_003743 [Ovis ammon polii]|uniref:Uncharacterized protein n=1 Tax=Ovis ammon polii TaxID=230172 RepID=A0AAD4UH96_OVIAM|nr:hypothetical protein MG293_003743 [Ovis ammon polii]
MSQLRQSKVRANQKAVSCDQPNQQNLLALKICSSKEHKSFQNWLQHGYLLCAVSMVLEILWGLEKESKLLKSSFQQIWHGSVQQDEDVGLKVKEKQIASDRGKKAGIIGKRVKSCPALLPIGLGLLHGSDNCRMSLCSPHSFHRTPATRCQRLLKRGENKLPSLGEEPLAELPAKASQKFIGTPRPRECANGNPCILVTFMFAAAVKALYLSCGCDFNTPSQLYLCVISLSNGL